MTEAVDTRVKAMAPKMNNTVGATEKTIVKSVSKAADFGNIQTVDLEPVSPVADITALDLVRVLASDEDCAKIIKEISKELSKGCPKLPEGRIKEALRALRKNLKDRPKSPWEVMPEVWPQSVDIQELVRDLESLIGEVIYCPAEVATATAYFCLATWFVEFTDYAPYICVTAATRQCGKSTLMGLMRKLSRKAYSLGSDATSAALFRVVDLVEPTLFCDEVDTYLKKKEDLQGVLNCGNSREDALVTRCEKDRSGRIEPVTFSAYGFKVLSGIKAEGVGNALIDRCIVLCLEPMPKAVRETKTKIRDIEKDRLEELCRKCARLAEDLGPAIQNLKRDDRPMFPEDFDSRECDKWELIFTLAQFAGPEELDRVKAAALTIKNGRPKNKGWEEELLADTRELYLKAISDPTRTGFNYEKVGADSRRFSIVPSNAHPEGLIVAAELNEALKADPDKRWATFGRNFDGLTVPAQSRALSDFGIKTVSVKACNGRKAYPVGGETGLNAAFAKYLPPLSGLDTEVCE